MAFDSQNERIIGFYPALFELALMTRQTPALTLVLFCGLCYTLFAADPGRAHASFPTYYSAKSALALRPSGLETVVVIEVPLFAMVVEFNDHYSDIDLIAEIEKGRIEELEDEFRKAKFEQLAKGLRLEIDGHRARGSWQPVDTPVNGRGAEGFFVYMLEFEPEQEIELGRRAEIRVINDLYEGEEIVLANYIDVGEGWELLQTSTPQPAPGADLTVGSLEELAMWSEDPERRTFEVVVARR